MITWGTNYINRVAQIMSTSSGMFWWSNLILPIAIVGVDLWSRIFCLSHIDKQTILLSGLVLVTFMPFGVWTKAPSFTSKQPLVSSGGHNARGDDQTALKWIRWHSIGITPALGCFAKSTFQPKIKGIPSRIPPVQARGHLFKIDLVSANFTFKFLSLFLN